MPKITSNKPKSINKKWKDKGITMPANKPSICIFGDKERYNWKSSIISIIKDLFTCKDFIFWEKKILKSQLKEKTQELTNLGEI